MATTVGSGQTWMKRAAGWTLLACVPVLLVPACNVTGKGNGTGESASVASPSAPAGHLDQAASREAFLAAYAVFQHPRCKNCHPAGDVPLQGEDSHLHAQNVKRGPEGRGLYGMKCEACHQSTNLAGANLPPGAPKWHLPPAEMVFEGKSPRELALQLKDPKRNGGKTVEGALEHLASDPLVLWGWAPGDGRAVPPLSHSEFLQKMRLWVETGAAVPE